MQYNGYTVNQSYYGWVIYDSNGRFVLEVATDEEAYDFIDNHKEQTNVEIDIIHIFRKYCKKLPNLCFPDNVVLSTTNEEALKRFINSFKKQYNVEIDYEPKERGGELFFDVYNKVLTFYEKCAKI